MYSLLAILTLNLAASRSTFNYLISKCIFLISFCNVTIVWLSAPEFAVESFISFRYDCLAGIGINSLMKRSGTFVLQQNCLRICPALFRIVEQATFCWSNLTRLFWIFGLIPLIRYASHKGVFSYMSYTIQAIQFFLSKKWHIANFAFCGA